MAQVRKRNLYGWRHAASKGDTRDGTVEIDSRGGAVSAMLQLGLRLLFLEHGFGDKTSLYLAGGSLRPESSSVSVLIIVMHGIRT